MLLLELFRDGILTEGDTRELMGMMKKYDIDYDEYEDYYDEDE